MENEKEKEKEKEQKKSKRKRKEKRKRRKSQKGLTPTLVCTNLPGVQARRRFFYLVQKDSSIFQKDSSVHFSKSYSIFTSTFYLIFCFLHAQSFFTGTFFYLFLNGWQNYLQRLKFDFFAGTFTPSGAFSFVFLHGHLFQFKLAGCQ